MTDEEREKGPEIPGTPPVPHERPPIRLADGVFDPELFGRHMDTAGITIEMVSRCAGVKAATVARWMNGTAKPRTRSLIKIAQAHPGLIKAAMVPIAESEPAEEKPKATLYICLKEGGRMPLSMENMQGIDIEFNGRCTNIDFNFVDDCEFMNIAVSH